MNTIELIPEDSLLEFIGCKLGRKTVKKHEFAAKFPVELSVSEEFVENLSLILKAYIPRHLVSVFGRMPLYCIVNDETTSYTVSDKQFWENVEFRFSDGLIRSLWNLFRQEQKCRDVNTIICGDILPWDVLVMAMMEGRLRNEIGFRRLLTISAPDVVLAYFLISAPYVTYSNGLPWKALWDSYDKMPYPVRFLLIDKTADFYSQMQNQLENMLNEQHIHSEFLQIYEINRNPDDMFCFDIVETAINHWANNGALGYDDGTYINGAAVESGIFETMHHLRQLLRSFGQLNVK